MHRLALGALAAAAVLGCAPRPPAPATAAPAPPAEGGAGPAAVPSSADTFDLIVAATTDVHGHLRAWDYYADRPDSLHSLAGAAAVVDSLRAAAPGRVVLVDAGDLLQGTPLTYLAARGWSGAGATPAGRHPVVAAMNAMEYDAAAIGNHEFNYGLPVLRTAADAARFPFLAANVYRAGSGERAFPASRIVERGPLRVGIVGATTPGSAVWDRDRLAGVVEFRDIVAEVRAAVAEVRAQVVDVMIVTVHSGLNEPSSYDTVATGLPSENVAARLASEVDGIDLIVYGHSHRQMADSTIRTTMLLQPKNWAQSVGVAHLTLARDGARWRVAAKRGQLVAVAGRVEASSVLQATESAHRLTVGYVRREIGTTPVAWRADSARVADTPLMDLILAVERKVAGAELASTAAFSLDASLDAGPITIAEVARLYPYENTLKAVRITGRQLRDYLEYSARYFGTYGTAEPAVDPRMPGYNFDIVAGAEYTIDLSRPAGSRITRLTVRGAPIADTDTFRFALNNYRQSGGGGYAMLRDAPVVYEGTSEIRQLLIEEVERRRTIRPADVFGRNWEIVPRAAIAPALAAMRRNPFESQSRRPPAAGAASGVAPRPAAPRAGAPDTAARPRP